MKYFTSTDLAWLNEMNSRGIPAGNVTTQWVEIIKHPSRDEWAACIPDDFLPRMAEILGDDASQVASNLKTADILIQDGWNV